MTEIRSFEIEFRNNINEIIRGDIRFPKKDGFFPLIIISHGFRAWKDWGFNPFVAEELSKVGAITITFDFSLNGRNINPEIIDTEKFAKNSISQELSDLDLLIEFFISDSDFYDIRKKWNNKIILIGFSLGGAISILKSKIDKRISKLVLWSTIGKFDRYTFRQKNEWKSKGFIEFPNKETNQILRLDYNFLLDIEKNKKFFNLANAIGTIEIPILIIHGEKDLTVPLKEVEMLFKAEKNYNIRKKIITKTGHSFGVVHPMKEKTRALEEALIETKDFLFNF